MVRDPSFAGFAVAAFAVWRIAHLVSVEDGPWTVFARWRTHWPALGCLYCTSVWIALPFALALIGDRSWYALVAWPALSGAAIAVERLTWRS